MRRARTGAGVHKAVSRGAEVQLEQGENRQGTEVEPGMGKSRSPCPTSLLFPICDVCTVMPASPRGCSGYQKSHKHLTLEAPRTPVSFLFLENRCTKYQSQKAPQRIPMVPGRCGSVSWNIVPCTERLWVRCLVRTHASGLASRSRLGRIREAADQCFSH